MTARTAAALVMLALALDASTARGDAAAQARFHDEMARRHYEKKRYEDAVREFFLEQRLAPNPRIAFNIALCFEHLRREEDAYLYFAEFLASADQDAGRRAYAENALAKLATRVALVEVKSDPPGALVYVDQREHGDYGATPRTIAVVPGEREVWVELEGHRRASTKVTARTGGTVSANLSPQLVVGKLRLESSAPGTAEALTGDGSVVAQGRTPFEASLPPATYQLVLHSEAHLPWRGVATVRADDSSVVVATPQRAPQPSGDITVTSNVPGSLVELDGQAAGFTPTVLSGVRAGDHRVRVSGRSLVPWSGGVSVGTGERTWVTVTLEEPPRTERSVATWVVGGIGVTGLVAAGVTGFLASSTHADFEAADPSSDRRPLLERGRTLNTATDVLLVTGALATGIAVGLYFGTAEVKGRPSGATVTPGTK